MANTMDWGFAMGLGKKLALFAAGGLGYVTMELLWRGRSHYSMFAAGGLCFLLVGQLGKRIRHRALQGLLGAAVITAVELLTGLLINRDFRVWDYRNMPYHFQGQICLCFTLLWIPLSIAAAQIYGLLEQKLGAAR